MNRHGHTWVMASIGAVALLLFVATGAGTAALGVGLVLLVCPLVLGVVMWLLMRGPTPRDRPRLHGGDE